MTLGELLDIGTTEVRDTSDRTKKLLKFGMNEGLTLFRSKLGRHYALATKRFRIEANSRIYQAPEDMIRGDAIYFHDGDNRIPLTEVKDINEWDRRILQAGGGTPGHFRWISNDLFELDTSPSATVVDQGEIRYLSRAKPLSADDYTTGTVALTQDSAVVTGTGTVWTNALVGRHFRLGDGNDDTNYYRVISVESATSLTLENYFMGATQSGKTYMIGEMPNIPQEYHFALLSKGLHRWYRSRKNKKEADSYFADFRLILDSAEGDYTGSDVSAVIESRIRKPRFGKFPNRLS